MRTKIELEHKVEQLKTSVKSRSYYSFSELFIALMHLKVIRTYIDGVLRFGIPPNFYMAIVKPHKNMDKKLLSALSDTFCDASMKEMYGSKEETNDTEDFFPFVCIHLTSPFFLQ
jgi:V-type H+-transporting ATPase subunit C